MSEKDCTCFGKIPSGWTKEDGINNYFVLQREYGGFHLRVGSFNNKWVAAREGRIVLGAYASTIAQAAHDALAAVDDYNCKSKAHKLSGHPTVEEFRAELEELTL